MNDSEFKRIIDSQQCLLGSGAPAASAGQAYDFYIDQTNRRFYRKVNDSTWTCNPDFVIGPVFDTMTEPEYTALISSGAVLVSSATNTLNTTLQMSGALVSGLSATSALVSGANVAAGSCYAAAEICNQVLSGGYVKSVEVIPMVSSGGYITSAGVAEMMSSGGIGISNVTSRPLDGYNEPEGGIMTEYSNGMKVFQGTMWLPDTGDNEQTRVINFSSLGLMTSVSYIGVGMAEASIVSSGAAVSIKTEINSNDTSGATNHLFYAVQLP